ncbi:UDP-2,4-diacetamido-2,4,6-trideoxy-beta-L-altropyranose hydrolase [Maribacter polysaccharolyticus]|uniref:UDP-2,4-diacetamido-2,4, 6-trideoxy-beta-L-altropyranose hydrolase n=1 Tax=Maribacter polysaccharolyticus TaxID=3020831 RepID=UPI00237F3485|nr:UDP-2,4-diacetamido-2,4,6-trideoxy-beta-L-altropyranose hydrolase [Maribacter polysaccharolyticus]MDE3742216.1 UDP-2,4-diacetamido-2,4,6-trideoxy-beta-L-altropyranose hydrolase [Maribacter polysaccharolyticus]
MGKKRILFRADGNSKTGLGHLYRVFALIEMIKEDYEYTLLIREDSELVVIPKSYNLDVIPSRFDTLEEPNWILKKYEPTTNIIIADGYAYNSSYQKEIKKAGYKLIYIDDLTTIEMSADIVVNHSLIVKPEHFRAKPNTKFALGANYAMLRPKFIEIAKRNKRPSNVKEVLVSFGGADFYDLTSKAVKALTQISSIKKINVLIGAANKNQHVYKIEKEYKNVIIHKNLAEAEVIDVMEKCQLAIIPSSTISYEVCSVKMLVICGYFIDNQELIYHGLKGKNVIYPAGDFKMYDSLRFEQVINEVIEFDLIKQNEMLKNQKTLFDGNQKERFLDIIKKIS